VKVRLRPEAKADIAGARDWYARQREGLDLEFRDELKAALQRITENPRGYAIVHDGARAAPLRRFPYLIFFLVEKKQALVIAVIHAARHPAAWKERL
jgi:plasmid stabilization system protein ParE